MGFYARVVGYEADYVAMIFLFRICCLVKLVIKLAGNYNKYRCWLERALDSSYGPRCGHRSNSRGGSEHRSKKPILNTCMLT